MLLEGLAGTGGLVASAFAEPGGFVNFLRSRTDSVKCGRNYSLTGVKFPCSLITSASLFCVSAAAPGGGTLIALAPADTPGLVRAEGWNAVAMRGSDTGRLDLTDAEVDSRLVLHETDVSDVSDMVVAGLVWFAVLLAGTYHGVLSSAMRQACAATTRTQGPQQLSELGAATAALLGLGATAQQLAAAWSENLVSGATALAAALALRRQISKCRDTVHAGLAASAGSVVLHDRLAQTLIDTMAAHHHPPALAICDGVVGTVAAGRVPKLDDFEGVVNAGR